MSHKFCSQLISKKKEKILVRHRIEALTMERSVHNDAGEKRPEVLY
jgi:hypothetical protein